MSMYDDVLSTLSDVAMTARDISKKTGHPQGHVQRLLADGVLSGDAIEENDGCYRRPFSGRARKPPVEPPPRRKPDRVRQHGVSPRLWAMRG